MLATILELFKQLLTLINVTFVKYFPPKATETQVEEDQVAIAERLRKEQETGRPQ